MDADDIVIGSTDSVAPEDAGFEYLPACATCRHWEELHHTDPDDGGDFCCAGDCDCTLYVAPAAPPAPEGTDGI